MQSGLVVTPELGDHCWRWVHTRGTPASCDLLSIIPTTTWGHWCGHQCKMSRIPWEPSSSCPSPSSEQARQEPSRGPPMRGGRSSLGLNTARRVCLPPSLWNQTPRGPRGVQSTQQHPPNNTKTVSDSGAGTVLIWHSSEALTPHRTFPFELGGPSSMS